MKIYRSAVLAAILASPAFAQTPAHVSYHAPSNEAIVGNNNADWSSSIRIGNDAHSFWIGGSHHLWIRSSGNVGLGIPNPTARLQVADSGNASLRVGVPNNASNAHAQIRQSLSAVAYDSSSAASLGAVSWNNYNDGNSPSWSGVYMNHNGADMPGTTYGVVTANSGHLIIQNCANAVIGTNGMTPIHVSPFGQVTATFAPGGNVGIGTTSPTHKLVVNGTIKAKEVIVETTGWSDYVFADDYTLAPLAEVEAHIKEHKHLPGIPSAAQVSEQGVSVGDMQAKLLAKIEELTLHQIAQEKRAVQQAALAAEQAHEIATLRSQIAELKAGRPQLK